MVARWVGNRRSVNSDIGVDGLWLASEDGNYHGRSGHLTCAHFGAKVSTYRKGRSGCAVQRNVQGNPATGIPAVDAHHVHDRNN